MQRDVHHHLVEGAVHEGRVDRHDRMQPAEGESGRRGDRVLLGDADVIHPVGEALCERQQARRAEHRGRNADDVGPRFADGEHFGGERIRPRECRRAAHGMTRYRVDAADGVELIGLVVQCGLIAAPLLGDRVHDHGCAETLRKFERLDQHRQIMTVDGTEILDVEIRVQRRVVGEARQEAVRSPPDAAIEGPCRRPELPEQRYRAAVQIAVGVGGADAIEVACHAADGGGVRTAVVVDDDHQVAIVVVGDVVQGLPRHPAGERTVSDHGHDVPVFATGAGEGSRDAVRPAEGTGGVGGLDDVVRAFGALRVAGHVDGAYRSGNQKQNRSNDYVNFMAAQPVEKLRHHNEPRL